MEVRQNTEKEITNLGIGTVDLSRSPDCGICHDIILFLRGGDVVVVDRRWV